VDIERFMPKHEKIAPEFVAISETTATLGRYHRISCSASVDLTHGIGETIAIRYVIVVSMREP
jgi:hypothetical protein